MKLYESAEDYLERILILKKTNKKVISLDLANSFGFSKPSISRAVKNLKNDNYIVVEEDGNIELTNKGLEIANKIYERHTVLTNFLISLGVDEETAKKDACKMEHDLSEESFNKIKDKIAK